MSTSINFNTILGSPGHTSIVVPVTPPIILCPDTDANTFLLVTGITDTTTVNAICTLVTDLKSAGLWNKMTAVYPFVGTTSTTQKYNLKNPSDSDPAYRLTFSGGIVHSATGALPNGVNGYANTFVNSAVTNFPSPNYISMSYYSRTGGSHATGGNVIGSFGNPSGNVTSARMLIRYVGSPNSTVGIVNYNDGVFPNALTTTDTDGRGLYITTRSSSANKLFIRGVLRATGAAGSTNLAPPPYNMFLFAYNNRDSGALNFSNKECAFAHIGIGLSDAEAVSLTTIVNAFQTTLGRNV